MLNNFLGTGTGVASSALTEGATATSAQDVLVDYDTALDEFLCRPHEEAHLVVTPAPLLYGWVAPENRATYYYYARIARPQNDA